MFKINDFTTENNNPVGLHGGTSVNKDLTYPGQNHLKAQHIIDTDADIQAAWTGNKVNGSEKFLDREE